MKNTITDEKLDTYFDVTGRALEKAKAAEKQGDAHICIDMAERYYSDAKHFRDKGDYVLAFGALNYAHGWLDCAARLGLIKVSDSTLFTVD